MKKYPELNILLVEDEAITAQFMKTGLLKLGFNVTAVGSAEKAFEEVNISKPDLILMDINLTGKLNGLDAMERINQNRSIPVIYITGYVDEATEAKAKQNNTLGFLKKPININQIIDIMEKKGLI